MNIICHPEDSIVGMLATQLRHLTKVGASPIYVELDEEEYKTLLQQLGAPPGAHVAAILGIPLQVDGETPGGGGVVVAR
jgi:hypothetical protein